ncbi:ferritin family protein [Thermococcus sp. SY098]|uniref:ferritin-like domain-containing protein n=1 Tax=Thermococcus sp. SY098 TaxID=3111325 RepID=UPI002D775614|nr:ferritin family protein [Thermococcus sp. SY098]WRS52574.1 ferritin family protein [Thermococcus sp. SY098]
MISMEEEIVKKLEKLPEREILGYAIASEEDAIQFYLKLSEGKGELIAEFFKDLAKAEQAHKTLLLNLHENLFGSKEYTVSGDVLFAESTVNIVTLGNLVEALKTALMTEKTAERVYTLLAQKLPEHRILFDFLAAQERAHYRAIEAHEEYLEGLMRGKPEYVEAPPHVISNQVEIYYKPRT